MILNRPQTIDHQTRVKRDISRLSIHLHLFNILAAGSERTGKNFDKRLIRSIGHAYWNDGRIRSLQRPYK